LREPCSGRLLHIFENRGAQKRRYTESFFTIVRRWIGCFTTLWQGEDITTGQLKELLKGRIRVDDLTETDLYYDCRQKEVDMKIGLDIASLSLSGRVDQMILISGDSDFVPAAKLARRAGVDFILDPMWNPINPNLHEHIDGLQSPWNNPNALRG